MKLRNRTPILLAALLILQVAAPASAKNVDLVTLPNRDTVQLTIYNSEDITLARETRSITLKKGANRLQFSWAGTLIDPTSVEFRPLEHADKIELADTVFPGQKPQHLIWNIESEYEGQALVEVSYFTSGLTWRMDYVATSNPQETELKFRGHVRVFNNSGEEYENAEVRLIVGKINLIEKIADLAKRNGQTPPKPSQPGFADLRNRVTRDSFRRAADAGAAGPADNAKQVVKEGVSEYFMFSVEGQETIGNGWSKRMPAVNADGVEFDIVYRQRAYQYGPRPQRFFIWRNDLEHKLGDSPLPNGVVRIFRDNGNEGLSYMGQQTLQYVPVKAEIEVNLGADDLVVYEQRSTKTTRLNFQFNRSNSVVGWDEKQSWIHTVRNYRDKPIAFELRLQWTGDVDVTPETETTSFDYRTIETKFAVAPMEKSEYEYSTTIHHGQNAKQNRVKLKRAE
ncbi:MAG: hypothetical protein QGG36_18380 [Pirellulaceae bacterium]|jgi:hypothetical protein|nr:hypothetical protein [Pirellulaceae bacterium]MDP7017778.1 hypothetical protein [Pirellulaceae bacterium]